MRNLVLINTVLIACIVCAMPACHSDHSHHADHTNNAKDISAEADTRLWVKEAFAKIDYMKVNVAFNSERVAIIKQQYDQEADPKLKMNMKMVYGQELLNNGQTAEAIDMFNSVMDFIAQNNIQLDSLSLRNLYSTIGIAYMRHGEIQNCVQNHNHQSCFIPIAGAGVHQLTFGSENAIAIYETCLKQFPNDLESKYLLNIAYQTLGKYPGQVPKQFLIDPAWFKSKVKIQPFKDIAPELGLNRRSLAGGIIVDDFTNDGWLDLVVTSWSRNEELIFYVNNGDGSFTDKTAEYGLKGHVGCLNLNQTDFNNDGWLDIYMMRGGWLMAQGNMPNTLLMNTGKGSFEDVTLKAGLTHRAPDQTSTWSDFNLDGYLDLFIGNESTPDNQVGVDLYINQKDGTFKHESIAYGLDFNYFIKGTVGTDINNDRYPDIYVSTQRSSNFLLINQGSKGQHGFAPVFTQSGEDQLLNGFPCWNFDYDNDGLEDLFVSGYNNVGTPAGYWMLSHMGKADPQLLPRLFHNKGNLEFEEVAGKMGLTEIAFTMGCNFGDINTDGFLDFYLATGNPQLQSIVPNKMYLNMEGKRFEDVSYSGGFANIQKGHGVSFGDLDHDGDEDLYVVIGGAFDGDAFYNCLFENPNEHNNNWIILKLTGTTANKPAIGARVAISVQENGKERKIYRTVTSGASFGANSLNLEVGLRKATAVNNVTVQWPCKDCPDQVFTGMEINKAYLLTQDQPAPTPMEYNKVTFKANEHAMHDMHH